MISDDLLRADKVAVERMQNGVHSSLDIVDKAPLTLVVRLLTQNRVEQNILLQLSSVCHICNICHITYNDCSLRTNTNCQS